eukprot:5746921-Pyramimonas_sp.AAC.1
MADRLECDSITFEESITVGRARAKLPPWCGCPIKQVGGVRFAVLSRGDKGLQAWFSGKKAYNKHVSSVITILCTLQTEATMADLGQANQAMQDEAPRRSLYQLRQASAAMRKLVADADSKTVQVTLPQVEVEGVVVPAVETHMPCEISPSSASLLLENDVFRWVFFKFQAEVLMSQEESSAAKRKADELSADS